MPPNMLDDALAYARAGIPVFPVHNPVGDACSCGNPACSNQAKHPRTANGTKDATADLDQVAEWWKRWPDANIGVVTGSRSGIVVIDCDGPGAIDWIVDQMLPITVSVSSGRGIHLWYLLPDGITIRNSAGKLAKGVDVRGEGGYVLAPGSTHKSGRRYGWTDDNQNAVSEATLPPDGLEGSTEGVCTLETVQANLNGLKHRLSTFPVHLLDQSDQQETATTSTVIQDIESGNRNQALTSYAGYLRRLGMDEEDLQLNLRRINMKRCKPPLPDREVDRIARSVSRYEPAELNLYQPNKLTQISMLGRDGLDSIPVPEFLVDGHIVENSLAVVFGPANVGKSFQVLDLSLSIATGKDWQGKFPVKKGHVVYLAAEGAVGIRPRVLAWEKQHGVRAKNLYVIPHPIQLMKGEEVNLLLEKLEETFAPPKLVVVDTLARCMLGGNENDAQDMGLVVAAADRIREATGGTVLIVHHTGKNGEEERGSTALRGAVDTMIRLHKASDDADLITVSCAKQKDFDYFSNLRVKLYPVKYGPGPETSCVVRDAFQPIQAGQSDSLNVLKGGS